MKNIKRSSQKQIDSIFIAQGHSKINRGKERAQDR